MELIARNNVIAVICLSAMSWMGAAGQECVGPGPYHGWWSHQSVLLCRDSPEGQLVWKDRHMLIRSPRDPNLAIRIEGAEIRVESSSTSLESTEPVRVLWPAELSWSPSGIRFQITQGTATTTGFTTSVFRVDKNAKKLYREPDFNAALRTDFENKYRCEDNAPNVYGIKWTSDNEILVIVQNPNRGDCRFRAMGLGYLIDVGKGSILHGFAASEVRKRWGRLLGSELNQSLR